MYLMTKTENAEKRAYIELEMSVIELDLCDVIRTSSLPDIDNSDSDNDQRGEWDPI